MDSWYIIVNPASGNGKGGRRWPAVEKYLREKGVPFEVVFTEHGGHAVALANNALQSGYKKLAAVGGDGTAHEVVNGIMGQTALPPHEVVFAIIPVGTGNDWIKTHHIPNDYRKAIDLMMAGKTMLHDVGTVNYIDEKGNPAHRYFFNVAGLGYDAFVTRESRVKSKIVSNKIFYFYLIIKCLWQYRPTRAKVTLDGVLHEDLFYTFNAGVCIFNGGGVQLVPHAVPDDGLLAATLVKNVSKWDAIKNTPNFYNGKLIHHPKVSTSQVKNFKVENVGGHPPTLLEVDGEFLGYAPLEMGILEKAIRVIVP